MALSGYVDRISAHDVTGWAHDARLPGQSLTLELLRDGAVVAQVRADQYRADLKAVGLGDGRHGFAVAIPPGRRGGALSVRVRGTEFLLTDTTGVQRERWAARLLHAREGDPALPVGFARRQPDAEDVAIAAGMLRHWATWRGRDAESAFIPAGGMWQYVQAQFQQDFVRCLDQDDAAALAGFLVRLPTTPTGEGFMQSAQATQDLLRSGMPGQIAAAVPAFDMLLSIANYLDCIPEENPEQGAWGEALRTPADAVLAAIEARVGHRVAPVPVFDHAFGLLSGDRVMDDRDAQALYAALRVRECGRGGPVLEIGGGIGKLAGQAWMLGLRDYTVVDLPLVSLLQYYALSRALGAENVEILDGSGPARGAPVKLVPAWAFPTCGLRWETAINCDSFPEMGEETCRAYLAGLVGRAERLLSLNQEAAAALTHDPAGPRHCIVGQVAAGLPAYRRASRFRHWLRRGYVDEVWEIGSGR